MRGEPRLSFLVVRPDHIDFEYALARAVVPVRHWDLCRLAVGHPCLLQRKSEEKRGSVFFGYGVLQSIGSARAPGRLMLHIEDVVALPKPVEVFSGSEGAFENRLHERSWRSFIQLPVRPIEERELEAVLEAADQELQQRSVPPAPQAGLAEEQAGYDQEEPRRRLASKFSVPRRDFKQRSVVRLAYENRCIATGLSFQFSDSFFGTEWSHWRPIELGGPDGPANTSIASRNVHLLIEQGWLGLDQNYAIIGKPEALAYVLRINPELKVFLPADRALWPAQTFLRWHRLHHRLAEE